MEQLAEYERQLKELMTAQQQEEENQDDNEYVAWNPQWESQYWNREPPELVLKDIPKDAKTTGITPEILQEFITEMKNYKPKQHTYSTVYHGYGGSDDDEEESWGETGMIRI